MGRIGCGLLGGLVGGLEDRSEGWLVGELISGLGRVLWVA